MKHCMHQAPLGGKKTTEQCLCITSALPKSASVFLVQICWEVLRAAWKEETEIKDKMKGQKAQKSEHG